MLTCQQLTEAVTAYLEGTMPRGRRFQIWLHIQLCKHCRRYFRQIRQTMKATGQVPPLEMPDEVRGSLEAVFARAAAEPCEDPFLATPPVCDEAKGPKDV